MDDISVWIYVLAIFIAIGGSLLKKKENYQKKNEDNKPHFPSYENDEDLDSEKDISLSEIYTLPEIEPLQKEAPLKTSRSLPKKDASPLEKGHIPSEERTAPFFEINDTEDLKRAVIFSEILNRKY